MTSSRIFWAVAALLSGAALLASALLTPSRLGHGTHTQLGLPPCGFLVWTGFPCPSCGLTTSFSHLAHFQLQAAVAANPLGIPLFFATALAFPLAVIGWRRSWDPAALHWTSLAKWMAFLLGCWVIDWLSRIWSLR